MKNLTLSRLHELLAFDAESGEFRWKAKRGKSGLGKLAGSKDRDGYVVIGIDGRVFRRSRLAWWAHHGTEPPAMIDHRDGDRMNDRPSNLRACSPAQNAANRKVTAKSRSGVKGAYSAYGGRFRSTVKFQGTAKFLGYFATAEQAHAAYAEAARSIHGDFSGVAR